MTKMHMVWTEEMFLICKFTVAMDQSPDLNVEGNFEKYFCKCSDNVLQVRETDAVTYYIFVILDNKITTLAEQLHE